MSKKTSDDQPAEQHAQPAHAQPAKAAPPVTAHHDTGDAKKHLREAATACRADDMTAMSEHLAAVLAKCKSHDKDVKDEHKSACAAAHAKFDEMKKPTAPPPPTRGATAHGNHKAACLEAATKLDNLAKDAEAGKVDWAALVAKLAQLMPLILALFA